MTAPDFDAMELTAARAFARDGYRQMQEARKELETAVAACQMAEEALSFAYGVPGCRCENNGDYCPQCEMVFQAQAECRDAVAGAKKGRCACGRTADGTYHGDRLCIVCLAEHRAEEAGAV